MTARLITRVMALLLATGALAACQTTDGGTAADITSTISAQDAGTGATVTFKGETYPMPPGDWVSVGVVKTAGGGWSAQRLILASVVPAGNGSGGAIDRVAMILDQDLFSHRRYNLTTLCTAEESYHHTVRGRYDAQSNECWHVRTVGFGLAGDPHPMVRALRDWGEARGLYVPVAMLGPRFIESQGRKKRQIEYLWAADLLSPVFDGTPATPDAWTKQAAAADPAKRAVTDELVRWAEAWKAARLDGAGS